jgi:hypothetical protein
MLILTALTKGLWAANLEPFYSNFELRGATGA